MDYVELLDAYDVSEFLQRHERWQPGLLGQKFPREAADQVEEVALRSAIPFVEILREEQRDADQSLVDNVLVGMLEAERHNPLEYRGHVGGEPQIDVQHLDCGFSY